MKNYREICEINRSRIKNQVKLGHSKSVTRPHINWC